MDTELAALTPDHRLGSRRVWIGARWYWDLKPDYKRGEIIEL